jgi:hypothetical protein
LSSNTYSVDHWCSTARTSGLHNGTIYLSSKGRDCASPHHLLFQTEAVCQLKYSKISSAYPSPNFSTLLYLKNVSTVEKRKTRYIMKCHVYMTKPNMECRCNTISLNWQDGTSVTTKWTNIIHVCSTVQDSSLLVSNVLLK